MFVDLGTHALIVENTASTGKFSSKVVLHGLRGLLRAHGVDVACAQSTLDGPGGELAFRANLTGVPFGKCAVHVGIALRPFSEREKGWNALLVLNGLRDQFGGLGIVVRATEKTASGPGGEVATRLRVS